MGFRFRKSISLGKGTRLNIGKKSVGISFGLPGMRHTINSSGRRTSSIGIPGTGLSYVHTHKKSKRASSKQMQSSTPIQNYERYTDYINPNTGDVVKLQNGISLVALLFGPFYLFYKRYWVQATLWVIPWLFFAFVLPGILICFNLIIASYINPLITFKYKRKGFIKYDQQVIEVEKPLE